MTGNIEQANKWWESVLEYVGIQRIAEKESALAANSREYNIDPESRAALDRGDRQRETGVYQDSALVDVEGAKYPLPAYAHKALQDLIYDPSLSFDETIGALRAAIVEANRLLAIAL